MKNETSKTLMELSKIKNELEKEINERVNLNIDEYKEPKQYLRVIDHPDRIVIANIVQELNHKQINSIIRIIGLENYGIKTSSHDQFSLVFYPEKKECNGVDL